MSSHRDPEFIYNTNDRFTDRFDPGDAEFFSKTAVRKEERGVQQLKFEGEDESLRKMYEEECAKNGIKAAGD